MMKTYKVRINTVRKDNEKVQVEYTKYYKIEDEVEDIVDILDDAISDLVPKTAEVTEAHIYKVD